MCPANFCLAKRAAQSQKFPKMETNGSLSPSQTTRLLRELGHEPVKKLGQNFLTDPNIVEKSLELAGVKDGDIVVEVGPGLGTLTGALLGRGARVYAVELDRQLFAYLGERFRGCENLSLVNADAVKMPLAALPQDCTQYKIVANLPYAISTAWLDRVLSAPFLPSKMCLMLQKEAAQRFTARLGKDFSPISITLSEAFETVQMHRVSAACFHPRPKVDSALLALARRDTPYIFKAATKAAMRSVFSKRRKQIYSIIKTENAALKPALERWLDECQKAGLSPQARPETISADFWKKLDGFVD